MESYTAPWASSAARRRLAAVEAALPSDPAEALERAAAAAHSHAQRLDEDTLQLNAGTNVPSPLVAALHESALAAQPSMGYPGAKYQPGLEALDVVEVTAAAAVARLMGAAFAEVRPTSATLANLAVYTALTDPGDTIAVLPDWAGGRHAEGAASVRGLRVATLPYDAEALDVDLDALDEFLGWEIPRLLVLGGSLMLFPHRLSAIADVVRGHGIPLLYDASHVAGLIAEGRFQDPLREGADLMTFSTYTSFGGPPGGVIVTNDAELAEQVANAVHPVLLANYDASRLVPLAAAALERDRSAGAYADQCIANAQALAEALAEEGFDVVGGADRGYTASHHVAIEIAGGGTPAASKLAESNLLASDIGVPADPAGGVRFGTQAITRQGFVEDDMPAIAAACAGALLHDRDVRREVGELRRRRTGLRWCLTPEDLP